MEDNQIKGTNNPIAEDEPSDLGNEILKLLGERTKNPGDAYVLLQQLSIFIWHQYKIDWTEHDGLQVAADRKQRCLDYVSQIIDAFTCNDAATSSSEAAAEAESVTPSNMEDAA